MTRRMMIIMTGPQILHLQLEFATPLLGADRLRLPGFDRCILDLVTARGRLIGKGQTLRRSHDGCRVAGRLIRRVFGTGKQGSEGLWQMVFYGGYRWLPVHPSSNRRGQGRRRSIDHGIVACKLMLLLFPSMALGLCRSIVVDVIGLAIFAVVATRGRVHGHIGHQGQSTLVRYGFHRRSFQAIWLFLLTRFFVVCGGHLFQQLNGHGDFALIAELQILFLLFRGSHQIQLCQVVSLFFGGKL